MSDAIVSALVEAIDEAWERMTEPPRSYIGASTIGNQCDAFLAFSLRGFPSVFGPRQKRIFQLGKIIEAQTIGDLKAAGIRVWERDPATGKQWEWEDWGGHISCHADGKIAVDENAQPLLLEIKSMNDSEWQKTKKHGLKKAHSEYYEQVQMMMGMGNIHAAIFVFYNKDNSAYWAEVVLADELVFYAQRVRMERVFDGAAPRIGKDRSFWKCKLCSRIDTCWGGKTVERKTCPTCRHSHPVHDGTWHCRLHDQPCGAPCGDWKQWEPTNA